MKWNIWVQRPHQRQILNTKKLARHLNKTVALNGSENLSLHHSYDYSQSIVQWISTGELKERSNKKELYTKTTWVVGDNFVPNCTAVMLRSFEMHGSVRLYNSRCHSTRSCPVSTIYGHSLVKAAACRKLLVTECQPRNFLMISSSLFLKTTALNLHKVQVCKRLAFLFKKTFVHWSF